VIVDMRFCGSLSGCVCAGEQGAVRASVRV